MTNDEPVPYWEAFRAFILIRHPEWSSRFSVARDRPDEEPRFRLSIPSEHPTITAPLVVEIADREHGGSIDLYWGESFDHTFRNGMPMGAHFERVLAKVGAWMDDRWVFVLAYDLATGRRNGWGRFPHPLPGEILLRADQEGRRLRYWSWHGTHDGEWPPSR